ncbi:MAG TPA: hypothetical protein HA264_04400 [Methanolinea sp.]|jgi:predicted regulator of Ras-like GTPase activity (Roadblock/LC7/MglB family)|nr:hypothetical protein [Methanolinea sp.]HNS83130.1 hypothetical protein [Methanolinea sp.]
MTGMLPAGFPVGEMQAPFKWMLIHAARFQGMIRVQAPDGEGHVLVRKGTPMGCSFRRGSEDLKGEAAYQHILSFPVIDLSIHRYTTEEMEEAIRLLQASGSVCGGGGAGPAYGSGGQPGETGSATGEERSPLPPAEADAPTAPVEKSRHTAAGTRETSPGSLEEAPMVLPSGLDVENLAHLLLGRMLRLQGVQAVSIFGRGKSVLSIGDVELDSLVVLAEDMLHAAKDISSVMRTGAFVHLTLQIPAGKVIIAPYFNEYICILTSPGVNLGQIRKILKEIPETGSPGRTVS